MKFLSDQAVNTTYLEQIQMKYKLSNCKIRWLEFTSGELICQQGNPLEYIYFLVKGKVKIYTTSPEGRQLIVAFNRPLEVFGDVELIQNGHLLNTVEAVTPIVVGRISVNEANRLRATSDLDSTLLDIVSRKFLTKSTTLSFHLLHPTDVRFASYLYSITHDENGNCVQKKIASKDLKEIAGFINTTVRHQNRILHSFQKEGIIERIRGGLLLKSPSQLKDKANDNLYEIQ